MQRPPPWPYGGAAGPCSNSFYSPIYFLTNNNAQFPGNLQYVQPTPSNPQPVFQNPRAVLPQKPYRRNPGPKPSQFPEVTLAGVESAAAKANRDILTAGENVTAWKVSQSALVVLQVDSWSSLGFQLQDVPTLKRLLLLEGKVNAFIHCFVCARKITSIYELEVYLCKNEGVMQFEELGLGPFLQHPLVKHYFSVTSDSTEVFKITSEEIIRSLQTFMSKFKKKVSAEEFLSFLAQQKSIPVKENLGICIQDIGSLVYHMRKASKAENTILREKLNGSDVGSGNIEVFEKVCGSQPPSIALEKQLLDKRFDYISSCVKSFSSKWIDFGGKHVYFNSSSEGDDTLDVDGYSDDEDDGENNTCIGQKQSFSHGKGLGQYVSSCPYPSKAEEMIRLGLKPDDFDKTSHASGHIADKGKRKFHASGHIADKGKRKFCRRKPKIEENNKSASSSCKFLKKIAAVDLESELQLPDLTLSNADIEKFATTWKEACQGHSVVEVFDIMLSFYVEAAKQRRKIRKLVSSYPVIGLLNVAIVSIKRGMLESLYDTFQALNQKEFFGMDSCFAEIIDVRPMVEDSLPIITMDSGFAVTADGIFKKIANYFENYLTRPKERGLPLEKQLASLKILHDCEIWLIAQFNVQEFSSLGHGNFYDFLEKHISLLPHEVHAVLYKEQFQATFMDVCLVEQHLGIMLSQAEGNLITEVDRSGFDIVSLLRRQFPAASFRMVGLNPEKYFEDLVSRHKDSGNSSCVLFSMCLLGGERKNLVNKENSLMVIGGMETEIAQQYHYRRTSKDAIECLLKAPMLSDLLHWSHWDLLYAPSLGPLAEWLLNKVNNKQLLCIATTNGKFIRVDHSSTIDEFLEALVQCSSFNAALKFLSLLCQYRGTRNAPLALLKCCVQKAVNVVIGNFTDSVEINGDVKSFTQGKIGLGSSSSFGIVSNNSVEQYNQNSVGSTLCTSVCRVNSAIAAVSRTLLGCLQYLPSEFRSFAADILLSGFRSIVKHAPIAVLNECTQPDERIMLHDIGLLLGVTEWVVDHQQFSSSTGLDLSLTSTVEGSTQSFYLESVFDHRNSVQVFEGSTSGNHRISLGTTEDAFVIDGKSQLSFGVDSSASACRVLKNFGDSDESQVLCVPMALSIDISEEEAILDATAIVESIRCEEFGLNSDSNQIEDHLLKKQHARLGRALHCLSQELYSQDSHFILELVQNADDNIYSDNLEPELVFILEEAGIVVLNNEIGFSAANIRALCDIGSSTKKGSSGGYIGKKGIGFKSVFRVTDAPEIHSNGFHVKFDITEGQIGFVLPTIISPCNVNTFKQYLCDKDNQGNNTAWNTCILLPFRSQSKGAAGVNSIISMFSDLHPSLLLFLHRLRCIKFKNLLRDEFVVMRKETLPNGIIKISHGREVMSWLVISKKLRSSVLRTDIEATEISMAFTLQELDDGEYKPCLSYQPVFSFLPLRNYGLRFILQGDFVLPSSREEVDGDSAWNQWLLSEFPSLFVNAKQSFCALPCFLKSPGKALTIYMSFVPLVGEVHGFFSQLPHMLISLLRISKCLLQDSPDLTWVLPCRVLRGWNEQVHLLLSDPLLHRHLGLVYMHKDVMLSDTLARALGIRDYGPKVLVEVIASLCHSSEDLKSLGLDWLSAWLAAVHSTLSMHFSGHSSTTELENDVINDLRYIPFIPLSDGSYGCLAHGPIWLPCDVVNIGSTGEYHPEDFPCLYTKLRIVTPHLFMSATKTAYIIEGIKADVIMQMLLKIGVQQLSAHEVIRNHILDALSGKRADDRDLMIEYLSFIMLHFQFDCGSCHSEKADIILELQKLPVVLTNHGFKYPFSEPIHFGSEYGNPIDIVKLLDDVDIKWVEVDPSYLNHPSIKPLSSGLTKWRSFFIDLGVTDFVQVTCTDKNARDFFSENKMNNNEFVAATSYVKDWESPELVNLLSAFSSKKFRGKCIFLLEVLDKMWDDCYSDQARSFIISEPDSVKKPIVSSFMKNIREFAWIASTIDMDLHQPKSLFYDCEQVRSVLGTMAAYAYPQVSSKLLVEEIGFKMEVSIDDALEIFWFWRMSGSPFVASIAQMVKFYTFISNGIATSSSKIIKELILSRFIFIPFINSCQSNAPASGLFGSPMEVHWQDPTGSVDRMKELMPLCTSTNKNNHILCLTLATVYPSLHDFFVNTCGVSDTPPFGGYFQILQQLSGIALPSQAAHNVFLVMLRWANDLKSGLVSLDQISELKENFLKLENTVLPTELDRWVSLHPSFGLICWSDDDELKKQFKHSDGVDFMQFGDLSMEESVLLSGAVSTLLHIIGVPALSEIVSREAIFYGTEDNKEKVALVNWVLPYAQRYIYKLHMDAYLKLKQLGFEKINQLKVVVVSKLFYKYILRGRDCDSKGRFECNCLLQGSTLYAYKATDSHSIFSELSRFFFNGSAELHFANFLHMVTTMAETGSTYEQIDFFIVNTQKLSKLPDEEPLWSLPLMCDVDEHTISPLVPAPSMELENSISKSSTRRPGIGTNWPPTDWKNAPDFSSSITRNLRTRPWISPSTQDGLCEAAEDVAHKQDPVSVDITGNWTIEEGSMPESSSMLQDSQLDSVGMHENSVSESIDHLEGPNDVSGKKSRSINPFKLLNRDRISWRIANEQMRRTGRLGEMIAYQYFTEKLSLSDVKWVNQETETGLPYDLVVGVEESRQYIEVKATSSVTKDWFDITTREWLFAAEKGDSYSIAHVAIFGPNKATVTVLKNPFKLCQQNLLSLAILMSRRVQD